MWLNVIQAKLTGDVVIASDLIQHRRVPRGCQGRHVTDVSRSMSQSQPVLFPLYCLLACWFVCLFDCLLAVLCIQEDLLLVYINIYDIYIEREREREDYYISLILNFPLITQCDRCRQVHLAELENVIYLCYYKTKSFQNVHVLCRGINTRR